MPLADRTNEFRQFVEVKVGETSQPTRRKNPKPTRHDAGRDEQAALGKEYIAEAHVILNHISTLTHMLTAIRKPYLNVDSRSSPLTRRPSRNIDLNESTTTWSTLRHLTNDERDQIDTQARVILSRCASRVKEMEALEKRRVEILASKTNPLARLLPARLRQDASSVQSDFRAAHHSSITWYLNRRLAEASQTQKEMQEERVKRQLERTRTLGSGAAHEANTSTAPQTPSFSDRMQLPGTPRWLGEASSSIIAATIGAPASPDLRNSQSFSQEMPPMSDEDDEEIELSASQIMRFESENATILRDVQDTLESVQQAESRLMDISALQMELVTHLTRQTELTDQLYEDAIATTATVEKGNTQLREAKRRAKDGRLFILVFLVGASFSLLFLHYY